MVNYDVGYKKPPHRPWQPGESGNPKGRPKNTLTELLHRYVNENGEEGKHRIITELYEIATSRGMRGQLPALLEIFNRLDGKVADTHLIKGLIIHVGNEYAQLGLEANRKDLEQRQLRGDIDSQAKVQRASEDELGETAESSW